MWQLTRNLIGSGPLDAKVLLGDVLTESNIKELHAASAHLAAFSDYPRMLLCYLFGDYEGAAEYSKSCRSLNDVKRLNDVKLKTVSLCCRIVAGWLDRSGVR